ncbi:MAG: hypothetical protein WKH64_06200 [Chloroflexia bacterium]
MTNTFFDAARANDLAAATADLDEVDEQGATPHFGRRRRRDSPLTSKGDS